MGTNNITQIGTSITLAVGSQVDQYFNAITQTFVPRNASGVVTDAGGDIGSSTYHWKDAWFGDGSNVCFRVDSTNLRVGINVSSPLTPLHIQGSGDEFILLQNGNNGDSGVYMVESSITDGRLAAGAVAWYDGTANAFKINTGNGGGSTDLTDSSFNRLTILRDSGYVGLNVTNPNERLHLNGNLLVGDSSTDGIYMFQNQGADVPAFHFYEGGALEWVLEYRGDSASGVQNTCRFGDPNGADSLALQYAGGNVGIGFNAPLKPLHVYATQNGNSASSIYVQNAGTGRSELALLSDSVTWSILVGGSGSTYPSTFGIYDSTAAAFRMLIDTNGNFGIGTTNPLYLSHIYANNSDAAPLHLIEQDGTGDASLQFRLTGVLGWTAGIDNSDSDKFKIDYDSAFANDTFVIDTSGNLGLGVSDPDHKLELFGTSSLFKMSYDATTYSTINTGSNGTMLLDSSNNTINIAGVIDCNLVTWTNVNNNNWTFNAYAGRNITIESVTFDGGVVAGISSLTATNLTGTLQTAAQANITSLGTLTNLQVDNINLNGNTITTTSGVMIIDGSSNQLNITGTVANRVFFGLGAAIGVNNDTYTIDAASNGASSSTLYIGNQSITTSSDKRYKKNIDDSKIDALSLINQIRIVDFEWDDPTDTSYNNRNARGQWTGFIAQEAIDIIPTMINAPRKPDTLEIDYESDDRWMVDNSAIIPILMKSIQELSAKITELEGKLK